MKKYIFTFQLFLISLFSFSQHTVNKSDSLLQLIRTTQEDTTKLRLYREFVMNFSGDFRELLPLINNLAILEKRIDKVDYSIEIYNTIASIYSRNNNIDSAQFFYEKSITKAIQQNNAKELGIAYNGLGVCCLQKAQYMEATNYYKMAETEFERLNERYLLTSVYNNLALVYKNLKQMDLAVEYILKNIKELEENNFGNQKLINAYDAAGNIYVIMGQPDVGRTYFQKALNLSKNENNESRLAGIFGNLGNAYKEMNMLDSAIFLLKLSSEISKKYDRKSWVAITSNNLGFCYLKKQEIDSAIDYFNKSIEIFKLIDDNYSLSSSYLGMSYALMSKKDWTRAQTYTEKALQQALKDNNLESIKDSYLNFSIIDSAQNNFAAAYEHQKLFFQYNDSLNAKTNMETIKNLEFRYDLEKKEKNIELLEKNNELQTLDLENRTSQRNFVIAFLAVILFFMFVVIKNYGKIEKKNHALNNKNSEILLQQEEIITQSEEINAINEELNMKNKLLADHIEAKDKLLSIISHDLKNPFHTIMFIADVLISENNFEPKQIHEYHKNIFQTAEKGHFLLVNLLEWSRMQIGQTTFEPKVLVINTILADAINYFRETALYKGVFIETKLEETIEAIADENMLNTIFRNLISNAIKFTPSKNNITITAQNNDDFAEISIADTGIGISPEKCEKLFENKRNNSTKGTANEKGSGLGLVLCKELVDKHNAEISVKSELRKGTTFTLKLFHNIALPLQ